MKKRIIALSLLLFVFVTTLSINIAFADEISLDNIFSGEVIDITVKDSKQPHVTWDLPKKDMNEMIALLNNAELSEKAVQRSDRKIVLYLSTWNSIASISVYDNGSVIYAEDTAYSKEYIMTNYNAIKNSISVLLTTQSNGYHNSMPSAGTLVEISDWASESYQFAIDCNLLPEYMKVGYMTDNITREQFCDLISILLKKRNIHNETFNVEVNFKDTKNENVNYLVKRNIIMGKSNINFAPNDFLTREEAATILCRSLDYLGFNMPESIDCFFVDDTAISDWAKESVYKVNNLGIMIGMGENTFSPKNTFSKEQAITTILRIFEDYTTESSEKSISVRDLLPSNISEIYYQELYYPNAVWSVDSNKILELLNVFKSMKVIANSNTDKPFEGYSFAISSDKNPIMLYIRSNGTVSVKQDNITKDYMLSDLQYINKISEILN